MGHEWGTMPSWCTSDSPTFGEWWRYAVATRVVRCRSACIEALARWRSAGDSKRLWLGRGGGPIACRFRSAFEVMGFVPRGRRQQPGWLGVGFGGLAEASRSRSRGRRGHAGCPCPSLGLPGAQSAELDDVFEARFQTWRASLESDKSTSSSASYRRGSSRPGRRTHIGRAPPVTPGPR